jgi:hypothetical protein
MEWRDVLEADAGAEADLGAPYATVSAGVESALRSMGYQFYRSPAAGICENEPGQAALRRARFSEEKIAVRIEKYLCYNELVRSQIRKLYPAL